MFPGIDFRVLAASGKINTVALSGRVLALTGSTATTPFGARGLSCGAGVLAYSRTPGSVFSRRRSLGRWTSSC